MVKYNDEEGKPYDGKYGNKKYYLKEYHNSHQNTKYMLIDRKFKAIKK